MSDVETLDERLRAVERALTDGDHDLGDLRDAAELANRLNELDDRVSEVERRLDDVDAAVQALRGYVGNVRSVNREVERRADAALAAVESATEPPTPDETSDADPDDSDAPLEEGCDGEFLRRIREAL